jgi:hypothetical protein
MVGERPGQARRHVVNQVYWLRCKIAKSQKLDYIFLSR